MTAVKVAVPVYRGKRKFFLDKGRPWSVVEHLILCALLDSARTSAELAEAGRLPRRLVIEIIIRLMRAGWVELAETRHGATFRATVAGRIAADLSELPSVPKPMSRWMTFVIDRITGTIYRSREMAFHHADEVSERSTRELIVALEPRDITPNYGVHDLVDCLFSEDERFVGVDPAGDRLMERHALLTVRGGEIEGLSSRAPPELELAIKAAAASVQELPKHDRLSFFRAAEA